MLPSFARLVQGHWLDPLIDAPAAVFALGLVLGAVAAALGLLLL